MQFFWLVIGIVGILGAIVPAAQMGTEIYFDFQLFMLVVGIGIFYVIGSGGQGLKKVDNFGKGSFCLLYTSPSPRDGLLSRMPSSA